MDFDLNDEQRQLKDSLERMLNDAYGDLNKRHGYMKEPKGYSASLWKQYADLGLLGVPFAEEHGGLGQGLTETMIVAEAFGRALAIEPYLATVVLSGGALRHSGNKTLLKELVPAIVEGKTSPGWRTRSAKRAMIWPIRRRRRAPTARAAIRSRARSALSLPAIMPTN